jgi:energy-coupling factor transport system permease protein
MLQNLNPLTKLGLCLVWLIASMLVFDARFQMACIVVPGLVLVSLNRTSPLLLLAVMVPFGLFGMGFWTTNLLFHRDGGYAVHLSREALVGSAAVSAGAVLFLRALACGMISAFFALTTDPGALVRSLMVYARLPPRLGYSLFAALQLAPDLSLELHQMRLARAMKSGRPVRRIPTLWEAFSLVIPLLALAIRRAGDMAVALEARGLGPEISRTVVHVPRFGRRDLFFAVCALLVEGTLISLAR